MFVIAGRSRRLAVEDHKLELKEVMAEHGSFHADVVKTIGDVGSAYVSFGDKIGLVIVQSARSHWEA
jgi:hypothetical protein